ncbi:class I SAM-dependent methyltransferase [Helicobacter sp.]|uniref:class I SAM-dependent methyltransferase n=1 Tax=Helicobacter sp. TaxID=218 RepID=UPI0025B813E4|nr:class I SAM-dependent methyltransferase [Helicobacter sp.]MCI5968159.1 class I SAM-dependent methyltransferase [Helicobacter sp.]
MLGGGIFGVCDFNQGGVEAVLCGIPVYYHRCESCGFIFAQDFYKLDSVWFSKHIYNSDYVHFDTDFVEVRPRANAMLIAQTFSIPKEMRILDWGCGNGKMCATLRNLGYAITGYDAFVPEFSQKSEEKFPLIVAFEVVEHLSDVYGAFTEILGMLQEGGIFLFSTLLQPQNIRELGVKWWYIMPRNGHISIFTQEALRKLCKRIDRDFNVFSFNEGLHFIYNAKNPPKSLGNVKFSWN